MTRTLAATHRTEGERTVATHRTDRESLRAPWRALALALLAVTLVALPVGSAVAAPPGGDRVAAQAERGAVQLKVTIIEASRGEGGVDRELSRLSRYFERSFKDFKRFKQLGEHQRSVTLDGTATVKLPDGLELSLKHLGVEQGFVRLAMSLDGLKTTIKVKDGGLFFQAGRKHGDGILVLAIEATSAGK